MKTARRSRKKQRAESDPKRGTILITALSLLLACLGIAISIIGTLTEEKSPAAEAVDR